MPVFIREEEAKATSIAAPGTLHGPINVFLKKQGLLDADYDVIDIASDAPWMLLDTVRVRTHFCRNDCVITVHTHTITLVSIGRSVVF